MLALRLLLFLFVAGCTVHVVPAVGSRSAFSVCYQTTQGVDVFRDPFSSCPDLREAEHVFARVEREERVPLDGLRVYVVDAFVECSWGYRTDVTNVCLTTGAITLSDDAGLFDRLGWAATEFASTERRRLWGQLK